MRKGVLARYLIRVHIGPFLFALSAITGLIVVNSVAQRVNALVGKGLPWSVLGEFVLLSLPHTIALSLPMSVLVAVLYAFSQLASSNEITAMAAGGVRPARIMFPVLGLGVIGSAVMFYFNDTVLPESNHRLKNLLLDIGRKSPTLDLREQVVNELRAGTGINRYFLTADRIDHEASTLTNVTIFDANDPTRQRTTYAEFGEMAFNNARTDLYLTLHDGVVHEVQLDREGGFQRLYFERQIVPLREVGNELERRVGGSDRTDREMGFGLLAENARQRAQQLDSIRNQSRERGVEAVRYALNDSSQSDTAWTAATRRPRGTGSVLRAASFLAQDGMTQQIISGARARAARGSSLEQRVNQYEVEIHKKLAIALACIVFTLLGPPLALHFPRGGVGFVVTGSAVIFFFNWVGLIGGEAMADRRIADPALSMWLGNALMLIAAIVLLTRMGRTGATSRGGGEVSETLANLWARLRPGTVVSSPVESTG
jgi:lipopolysaccharide export system permease protein